MVSAQETDEICSRILSFGASADVYLQPTCLRSLARSQVRLTRVSKKDLRESEGDALAKTHPHSSVQQMSSFLLPGSASSLEEGADLIRMPDVHTLQRHAGLFKKLIFGQILSECFSASQQGEFVAGRRDEFLSAEEQSRTGRLPSSS